MESEPLIGINIAMYICLVQLLLFWSLKSINKPRLYISISPTRWTTSKRCKLIPETLELLETWPGLPNMTKRPPTSPSSRKISDNPEMTKCAAATLRLIPRGSTLVRA